MTKYEVEVNTLTLDRWRVVSVVHPEDGCRELRTQIGPWFELRSWADIFALGMARFDEMVRR